MPYVSDNNLDENEQTQGSEATSQQPGQVSGQPQSVSGSTGTQSQQQNSNSATQAPAAPSLASGSGLTSTGQSGRAGGGAASSTPSYSSSAPTSSGQWTNLQNYLSANNGGQFGQNFAGNIGNDVNQAQSAVSDAATNFANGVSGGTLQNNADVLNEVGTSPQTMSQADQTAFENQLRGSYGGPQSAEGDSGFQQANAAAQSAFGEAQSAGTPGGQTALLQKFYNTPTYTPGGQALDSAILTADPNAQAAIQSLAQQASGLPVAYQSAAATANGLAATGAANSSAAQQAAQDAIGATAQGSLIPKMSANGVPLTDANGNIIYTGAIGNVMGGLQSSDAAALKAAQDAITAQQGIFATPAANASWQGSPSLFSGDPASVASTLQSLGVPPDLAKSLANAQIGDAGGLAAAPNAGAFYTAGVPTAGNVADPNQVAQLSALYQLAGLDPATITNQYAGAGTPSNSSFDLGGYKTALGNWATGVGQQAETALQNYNPANNAGVTAGPGGNDPYSILSSQELESNQLLQALGLPAVSTPYPGQGKQISAPLVRR